MLNLSREAQHVQFQVTNKIARFRATGQRKWVTVFDAKDSFLRFNLSEEAASLLLLAEFDDDVRLILDNAVSNGAVYSPS
jgi:hypothetical protein